MPIAATICEGEIAEKFKKLTRRASVRTRCSTRCSTWRSSSTSVPLEGAVEYVVALIGSHAPTGHSFCPFRVRPHDARRRAYWSQNGLIRSKRGHELFSNGLLGFRAERRQRSSSPSSTGLLR